MKKQRISTIIGALALCGSALFPGNVFAANPGNFGITYSGGDALGSENVKPISDLIGNKLLNEIIPKDGVEISTTGGQWHDGYMKRDANNVPCHKYKYLEVNQDGLVGGSASFTISHGDYAMEIQIPQVGVVDFDSGETTAIGIVPQVAATGQDVNSGVSALYGGWAPYGDSTCTQPVAVSNHPDKTIRSTTSRGQSNEKIHGKVFVEMQIKLKNKNQPFTSAEILLGIIDIDASQSFKILNQPDYFKANKIYADDPNLLQPGGDIQEKNMFVGDSGSGSYLYSQYSASNGGFDTDDISNIYAPISEETQLNGLDIVFGFVGQAGSQIRYYSQVYTVKYHADRPGGTVKIRESEKVVSGATPLGADQEPDSGYKFTYWTADKDVEVNGKTITEGQPISMEQIKSIRVMQDYEFTAHYEKIESESKQYTVTYEPEEPGGQVTGISSEKVNEGENPSGSEAEADDGYTVSHWTTDQDVTLENGETIKKGETISVENIQKVVVDKNMKFIVHFKKKDTPNTPNTGAMTGGIDAATIATASIFGIVLIALAIKALPRLAHKKVNFD